MLFASARVGCRRERRERQVIADSQQTRKRVSPKEMFELMRRSLKCARMGGAHEVAKNHLALHLFSRIGETGNPRHTANFYDESLNSLLSKIAAKAYSAVYEKRILAYFKRAHRRGAEVRSQGQPD